MLWRHLFIVFIQYFLRAFMLFCKSSIDYFGISHSNKFICSVIVLNNRISKQVPGIPLVYDGYRFNGMYSCNVICICILKADRVLCLYSILEYLQKLIITFTQY